MGALLLCAVMALQDDAAAKTALDAFQATWSKDKSPDGRATAVAELAKTLHDKVCSRLGQLLTSEDKAVRLAAAAGLGTFKDPAELKKNASKVLQSGLTSGTNANDPDSKAAILQAIGMLQDDAAAPKVKEFFDDKDNKVAAAAVVAAGQLKNKTMVDPLIAVLKECEDEIKKANNVPQAQPGKAGKITPAKKTGPASGPAGPTDEEKKKRDRASALINASQTALATLTGASFKTSAEYEQWWSKNRGSFQPK